MNIPEFGSNFELWAVVIGFMLPALIAVVNQSTWKPQAKGVVAVLSSIVAGAGTAYFADQWNSEDILRTIMIILILSQVAYTTFWKPTRTAPEIETRTNVSSGKSD